MALIGAAAILALVVGAWVLTARRNGGSTARTERPAGSSPSVPAAVSGHEQRIVEVLLPPRLDINTSVPRGSAWSVNVLPGATERAYSVDGGTVFAVTDQEQRGSDPSKPMSESCAVFPETAGVRGHCEPLSSVEKGQVHAVFLAQDFPRHALDTTVWAHLPGGTAFVTFATPSVHLWQRPIHGTAAFAVNVPAQYQGRDFGAAPKPVLRAFSANGKLIATVEAPADN
ncbi:MAG TPA: hypothetical protein VIC35_08535 [Acidimicrobiia bacterium]